MTKAGTSFHARRIRGYGLACLASSTLACGAPPAPPPSNPLDRGVVPMASASPRVEPVIREGHHSPKADLSKQLGGLRLGMTVEEFTASCRGAQGEVTRVSEIDLRCSVTPEPLRSSTSRASLEGTVAGKFCGPSATVCELVYVLEGAALRGDDQTGALVEMLVGKYGPPSSSDGYAGNDPLARCRRDRTARFKRGWVFDRDQSPPHPAGRARLTFACDMRVSEEARSLTLSYDDEHGIRYRATSEQAAPAPARPDNF